MSPRILHRTIALVLGSLALTACDVGQGVKTLGNMSSLNGGNTNVTNSDAFAVTLAWRDNSADASNPSRVVLIQGVRGLPSANLVNECNATGTSCSCDLYSSTTAAPTNTTTVGISQQNNSFSCTIPSSLSNSQVLALKYVKLKRVDDISRNTGLINIKTTLTIDDVLGPTLLKTKVRGIFSYTCNRTFFEGEGVTTANVNCVAGQHLGLITATYNFYTYRSATDSNNSGGDFPFNGDVCKRLDFLKIQCTGNSPVLHYGFYIESADPFTVGITMTRAPQAAQGDTQPLQATYGFAALPDSAGNCPTGLMKVRPWVAQPASIVPNGTTQLYPTSYINSGNLNNTVVEAAAPGNFIVTRQPSGTTQCSTLPAPGGDCTNANFGSLIQAESVAYLGQTPVVCAIPPGLLNGLF